MKTTTVIGMIMTIVSLRESKACSKISKVTAHIDGWKQLLDLYGGELMAAPQMLRAMYSTLHIRN